MRFGCSLIFVVGLLGILALSTLSACEEPVDPKSVQLPAGVPAKLSANTTYTAHVTGLF